MTKIKHTRFLDKANDVCCCPEHHSHYGMSQWMQAVYATDWHSTAKSSPPSKINPYVTTAAHYVFNNKLIGTSHDKINQSITITISE